LGTHYGLFSLNLVKLENKRLIFLFSSIPVFSKFQLLLYFLPID
jgi:hypothetical protein